MIDEIVKPVDLGSKFKFFEEGGHQRMDKKTFRITPPRDEQVWNDAMNYEMTSPSPCTGTLKDPRSRGRACMPSL